MSKPAETEAKDLKKQTNILSQITERQILQANNESVLTENLHLPLVAWIPDWRTMKNEETKEPLVDPETGGPQYGYVKVIVDQFNMMCNEAGIRLLLLTQDQKIEDWVDKIDGILIPGGRDIDPALYGEENKGSKFSKEGALRRWNQCKNWVMEGDDKMPIFAICYGYQVLNCLYGGKINQHIDNSADHLFKCREFKPVEGTHLHKALNGQSTHNACFHHQNIINTPDCLIPNSFDTVDGTPHGLEWHDDSRTIMSILWHPEAGEPFIQGAEMDKSAMLFNYFSKLCLEYRASKAE